MGALAATTPVSELESLVTRVKEGSRAFARLNISERIALLRELRQRLATVAEAWARAAAEAKGLDPDSQAVGEEWLAGPVVTVRDLRLLEEALEDIRDHGAPALSRANFELLDDG